MSIESNKHQAKGTRKRRERDGACVLCRAVGRRDLSPGLNDYNVHWNRLEVSHITPRYLGGSDNIGNLETLCTPHHRMYDTIYPFLIDAGIPKDEIRERAISFAIGAYEYLSVVAHMHFAPFNIEYADSVLSLSAQAQRDSLSFLNS